MLRMYQIGRGLVAIAVARLKYETIPFQQPPPILR